MSNSTAVNEFTIRCGCCQKLKIVPTDRTPQAKAQYFKKVSSVEHYPLSFSAETFLFKASEV